MMEVKQKISVDFNDLITSNSNGDSNNSNSNSNSDEVVAKMTNLETSKQKTDLSKSKEVATNGAVSSTKKNGKNGKNGKETFAEVAAAIDLDVDAEELDSNEPVSAELEEALFADDETNAVDKILGEVVVPIRDPGDDLDTLLSKINDLVEDCIETDVTKLTTAAKPITEAERGENGKEDSGSNKENEKEETKTKIVQTVKKINDDDKQEESTTVDDKTVDNDVEMKSIAENSADGDNKTKNVKDTLEETSSDEKDATGKKTKNDNESNIETETDKIKDSVVLSVTLDDDDVDDKEAKESSNEAKPEKSNNDNTTTSEEKMDTESGEGKVSATSASLEIEDSDDDIIFYVDNPVETKAKKEVKEANDAKKTLVVKSNDETATETKAKPSAMEEDDDDVVLLDDDDDDENDTAAPDKKTDKKKEEICKDLENKEVNEKLSDEEKIGETKKIEDKPKVSDKKESQTEENKTELIVDNTDNASDDFAVAEKEPLKNKETPKPKSVEGDETNSNCSNSSSLLQEAKVTSGAEEEHAEEVENDEDDEAEVEGEIEGEAEVDAEVDAEAEAEDLDGDTELLEDMVTMESPEAAKDIESEDKEIEPPTKRIRLSVDEKEEEQKKESSKDETVDQSDSTTIVDEVDKVTKEIAIETDESTVEKKEQEASTAVVAVKRTHDSMVEESEEDSIVKGTEEDEEIAKKKIKTDEENSSSPAVEEKQSEEERAECTTPLDGDVDEKTDVKSIVELETLKTETEEKEEPLAEVQTEVKVIASTIPIPLYPPPKFDTYVSSIQLDFFKRFRKSLDKMTKNDLEELAMEKIIEAIVHKGEFAEMRDMIDKQEKIIASYRTKMTELSKHFRDLEMVHSRVLKDIEAKNSQFIMPVKITRAVGLQVFIPSRKTSDANTSGSTVMVSNSPQRVGVNAATSSHISPQRSQSNAEARTSTGNSALASAAAAAAMNTRRGCVQKITPQRPDPSSTSAAATVMTQIASSYRSASAQTSLASSSPMLQQNAPRILNKNSISASLLKNRYSAPSALEQQHRQQLLQQQQQISRQQQQQQIQNNARKIAPKPTTVVSAVPQYRRTESSTQPPQPQSASASNSVMDNYMTSLSQMASAGVPAVSITPAKPKEKAVIDLTDEDDAVSAAAAAASASAASARQRLPAPGVNNNTTQYASNRNVPPLTRMPAANQMIASNKPQVAARPLSTMQAQKPSNSSLLSSISTPAGTSITRVHISANNPAAQRAKFGHPAPLPATPPQTFNPAWKLPPPRPTIRISNLDNGIVISWTMDDAENRHAECVSYQIYAYQETSSAPAADSWRHVGDVKAMLLPMAVTLTQFQEGQRYYFAVRAVDVHQRFGQFSLPKTWS